MLGETLERTFGSYLTIGPPVAGGFYYDSYMGEGNAVTEGDFKQLDAEFQKICKAKQKFERLVVSEGVIVDGLEI